MSYVFCNCPHCASLPIQERDQIPTRESEICVELPCLECGKVYVFPFDSLEATGGFNVFCSDPNCEDVYASKH